MLSGDKLSDLGSYMFQELECPLMVNILWTTDLSAFMEAIIPRTERSALCRSWPIFTAINPSGSLIHVYVPLADAPVDQPLHL
jgi:hypothetical protein